MWESSCSSLPPFLISTLLSFVTASISCPHSGLQSCGDSRPIPDLCTQTSRSFNSGPGYNIIVRGTGCGCICFKSEDFPQPRRSTALRETTHSVGWSPCAGGAGGPGATELGRAVPAAARSGAGISVSASASRVGRRPRTEEPRRSSPLRRRLGRATRSGCRGN